ncbi:SH3 domain-containing protein [Achromobacter seleniivolatilans]|uniref:SH3 domain-containing protein n=1 Tax=Achromobacter seleniivolatilans TaxID=3047478 RepID=A0ABY9LZZ3_9BURK|nr:SH3 domain-containing protein [Achromobacter sp. R39]WMD20336.1 SH3 domain-containing protein [Achromobacter sp. R39]
MKGILLAATLAIVGLGATATGIAAEAPRNVPYQIKPGVSATVQISGGAEQRVSVRVGNGPDQLLGTFDDETIDQVGSVDINHDGYSDLVLGQSGGSTQIIARLFLYRPQNGTFQEIQHPDNTSPCRGFVNPVIDPKNPVISVACRYGAASNGTEEYVLRADGTVHATSWSTQALFGLDNEQSELTYHFREDGSIASIDIDGDGSPLEGGIVPVSKLDLYDTPDVNTHPALAASQDEPLTVVALKPRDWLQVRYTGKSGQEVTKWVRYGDLRVDKHQYLPPTPVMEGLELTLFNYLGDWDDESGGRFTLRLDNRGTAPVELAAPRIWLLLINAQGDRIVHPLYQRNADTLAAGANTGLADDPIVWRKDEDGTFTYMVNNEGYSYVPLVPDLAPGKYRAAVIMTDPGNLAEPLYSNEVSFEFPFPKQPPRN